VSKGLLTTSVGSFAKPAYLAKARSAHAAGRLSHEELMELTRRATKEVVALQDEVGLDIIVDGEMARGDMVAYFAEHLAGMKLGGLVRSYGNRYYHKPVIEGEVRWLAPITVDIWSYAQSLTDKPVKGMLTGPYTLVEWSFEEHYATRREAVMAMAQAVRQEALALEAAGARYIQIDEPACSTRPHEIALAAEAMAIVTEGLTAKTITHICYGNFAPVYDDMLSIPVDQFDFEMANSEYELLDLIARNGFERDLGLGVLDVHTHEIESVEAVEAGLKRALQLLPPERIYVDPDCGLKTRTWEESAAKLRVMVEAVRRVKAEYGIE
jgi:5-methyltetrahydropteroyltriglutamate--homocysteine methyltransferase